jgi:5'-nucleotidase
MPRKKILFTNDDGIDSPGLKTLMNYFSTEEYEITVVAPKHAQSAKGMSHAHGNVWVNISEEIINGVQWISVDNSPATCVSVALRKFHLQPDLVISGINFGENLGLNLFYSGTLGAAWEAAMSGFLSVAVSLELPSNKHFSLDNSIDFSVAATISKKLAENLMLENPSCKLWNINVPTLATIDTEVKFTSIAPQRWNYPVIREQKNVGESNLVRFEFDPTTNEFVDDNTDVYNLRKGFVTMTAINQILFPW